MTITSSMAKTLNISFPKLYKVVYAKTVDGVQAMFQRSYKDYIVDQWLEENCKHPYYHSPGWMYEKFIEFEDEKEALWFSLRFE